MIVDAHAHLGFDEVFDEEFTERELLESLRANGIDITLVQPSLVHDLDTVCRYHDGIAELCRAHPGRFAGVTNPSPHLPGRQYEEEVERCVRGLGFVGVKLHPFAHAVNPNGRHGRRVFDAARVLGVPVMVHTGPGLPWSSPALLAPIAAEFSDVSIVVAHGGGMMAGEVAPLLAGHDNVFVEFSWCAGFQVRHWVERFGAGRLMFGSDHGDNAATELAKVRSLGLTGEQEWELLGGTATRVFGLDRGAKGRVGP